MTTRAASNPTTATEGVLAQLRAMLVRGELRPGARLDQHELARRFDVSIVPLREALARLEGIGLVRIYPHRGAFVADVSLDELQDIYTVRKTLEEEASRLAAPRLDDANVAELERLSEALHAAVKAQDFDLFLTHNRAFHFVLYRAAGRPHMLQIIERCWDLSARYVHLQLYAAPERAAQALFEIRAITDAARRRDAEVLALMVRFKLHQTTVSLVELMQNQEGDGEPVPPHKRMPTGKAARPHISRGQHGTRRVSR
jgi:DNA-binding GntR family transcriptional regulator